jgi:WD40 repeat protein/DNA-binding SARP family transcriptional activator
VVPVLAKRAYARLMRFGVLGPLEVRSDGGQLAVRGVKERRLLALLLSRANSVVPVGDIVEALWGAEPPPSAAKSLQVYVVRVRKMLAADSPAAADIVSRRGSGYVLGAARDQVDAFQFADLVARAREAAAAGAHDVAALTLREALDLWRGPAYADFQDTWFGSTEAAHLGEMRLAAVEARIDADLALGRHAEVTAELESLVREHPLRERFWAQLMVALYRSGRQSDALLAFHRARSDLVEQIGVEPGPELRALEAAVLAQDPGLAAPDPRAAGPPELPAELPRAGPIFAGRDEIMSGLQELWAEAEQGRGGVALICGPPGSGRTRLAAELAHHAHARGAVAHYVGPGVEGLDLTDLARSAGARPVLLVIDDADQGGPGAAGLLEAAAAAAPRLRLLAVAAYDPARAGARLRAAGLRARHGRRVTLPPLDATSTALIVRRYLGSRAGPETVERIAAQAAGLPGRLHDLATAWMEQDASRRVAGAVSEGPAARQALSSVRATVREGVLDLRRVGEERAARAGAGVALCPYKGLARFEQQDAAIFHGREALVATLVARLADTPLVAVVGPSGAGKSSVVRAGLLPALAGGVLPGSGDWPLHLLSPGEKPLRSVAPVIEAATARPGVVVVDQFEELFAACGDETQRAGFIADLLGLLDRDSAPVRVVVTIRADYLGWCAAYPALASRIGDGTVLVPPMTDDEVRRAVTAPAQYAGLEVEEDLLRAVVADVRGRPGGLPLLSTALLDTWERRRGRTLTHAGYLAAGGVSGALARLADAAYARLDPAGQEAARRILVRLADTGEGGAPVRRRVPVEEMAAPGDQAARHALDVLVARRLVTVGEGTVEVAHEALLSHWPRLARWLQDDEQGRALRRHLAPAARDWAASGRPDAELYRGARLASALDWTAGHAGDLNPAETEFLEASRAAADRELREQKARADREARARRRLRAVLAGVVALLLFSAAAGTVAVQQRGAALQQRRAARAAQRSAEARRLGARALTEPDLDRSLLLAAAAVRTSPSLETEGDLLAALQRSPHALAQVRGDGDRLLAVAVSPDGRTLVASDNHGTLVFWDTQTMRRIGMPAQIGGWSGKMAFAPDGRRIAVLAMNPAGTRFDVVLWDVARRRILHRLIIPGNAPASFPAASLAWTHNGRSVAVESGTGLLTLYDAATGQKTGGLHVPGADPVQSVDAYAAGDEVLAVSNGTRNAVLVDPASMQIAHRIRLPVPVDSRVGVSPDGRTLALGDDKGRVFFEDLKTGQVRQGNGKHTGGVYSTVFSPDGQTVASTSGDQTVMLWDVKTARPRLTLTGHSGAVTDATFAPNGQILYTTSLDASLIAWDLTGHRSFAVTRPNAGHGPFSLINQPPYAAWSAGRRRAVLGFQKGLLAAMDVGTGRVTARGRPLTDLEWVALSPDGRYAYLGSNDTLLRRWDTTAHRVDKRSTLGNGTPKVVVSASADGRMLIVCGASYNPNSRPPCYFANAHTFQRVGPRIQPGFYPGPPAFSPDGRLVAIGAYFGRGLAILTVPGGRIRWANRSIGEVLTLGFSPHGRRLVAGSQDGKIAMFDAATGRQIAGPITAHAGYVVAVSFAPDGRIILTSGTDGAIRLWDAAHLRPVGEALHLLPDQHAFATFSPDGKEILGLDPTGRVTIWPATVPAWLRHACSIVRRNFTPQERTLYSITSLTPPPCP